MIDMILSTDGGRLRRPIQVAFLLSVALWIAATAFMTTVPLSGDENFYASAARSIAAFFRGSSDLDRTIASVVGYGWFAPGIPLLLSPLYLVDSTPDLALVRIYIALLTFLLWIWALREAGRELGPDFVLALIVFPGLDLTWHFFAPTAWGDLPAGLVLVVVFSRLVRLGRIIRRGEQILFPQLLALQAILVLAFYLRGNLLLVAAAANIFLGVLALISMSKRTRLPQILLLLGSFLCFAVAVSPWSIVASRTLGGTVISTSTPTLAFALTFGKSSEICMGPCPKSGSPNIWLKAAEFSRAYAREHGTGELQAQRLMAAHALRDLSLPSYLRKVRQNTLRFFTDPSHFSRQRFLPLSKLAISPETAHVLGVVISIACAVLFYPALVALLVSNLWVARRSSTAQIQSLSLKLLTVCVAIQPFFHISHARYWPALACLMGIALAFVATRGVTEDGGENEASAFLTIVQCGYAVCVLGVATVLMSI